jgi:hypothetical protein
MTNASARRRGILGATNEVFAFILQTDFDASELSGDRVLHSVQTIIGLGSEQIIRGTVRSRLRLSPEIPSATF